MAGSYTGQTEIDAALQAVINATPPDTYSSVGAAMEPLSVLKTVIDTMRQILPGLYEDPVTGRKRPLGRLGAVDPGSMGDTITDQLDKEFASGIIDPLKKELKDKMDQMLEQYYLWRYNDPDRAAAESKKPSIERLAVKALFFLRGDHVALRGLSAYMKRLGYNNFSMSPGADRRRKGLVSIASELYRQSTDLSMASPFQFEGVKDNMQALLGLFDAGGFKQIMHGKDVFDKSGNLTEQGRAKLNQAVTNAGRSVYALTKITGQRSAVETLRITRDIFGESILGQLDDEQTAQALNEYRALARMNGLTGKRPLDLLKALKQHFPKSSDPAPLLRMATQKLSFDYMGSIYSIGDKGQWNKLTMGIVVGIGRTQFSKAAAAGASALEQEYGRTAAWNIMDSALLRGIATPGRLVTAINENLTNKITRENLNSFLHSKSAYDYFRSGRMFPAVTTRASGLLFQEMRKRSTWANANLPRILKQYGALSPDIVFQYLKDNNADNETQGKVMHHLRQLSSSFGPNLGTTDMATQFALVTSGWKMRERQQLVAESAKRGDYAEQMRHFRGPGGANQFAQTMTATGNPWQSTLNWLLGSDYNTSKDTSSRIKYMRVDPKGAPKAQPAPIQQPHPFGPDPSLTATPKPPATPDFPDTSIATATPPVQPLKRELPDSIDPIETEYKA